jgi:chromosome segregation ATPase
MNNAALPPIQDPALIVQAAALLASLSDPKGTKARLQQLSGATNALISAKADHDLAKGQAEQAAVKLAGLQADKAALEDKLAEHQKAVLALQVASEANSQRGRDLDVRERAIEAQASDLQRRVSAHDARLKQFRDQLAS